MRRIKLVFATLVVLVAAFVAFSGPAVAEECEDAWGYLIECGGELYIPYDNAYPYYNDYSPFYGPYHSDYSPFYSDYTYEDYQDYFDELEDALDDYLDDLEDSSWGYNYYGW